jgi:putative peptide zinc metalloprotease protein
MMAFALATWLYRLVLFLGIALLVYNLFFKLLGIVLMAVEVIWFVALPVVRELMAIGRERARWRWRLRAWLSLTAVLVLVLWLVPVGREVSAPALVRATHDSTLFASSSARLVEVHVVPGQQVKAGDVLLRLESPDLVSRLERARLRVAAYAVEVARSTASNAQLQRRLVVEQQYGEALADEAGARIEIEALILRAPHDGKVRDLPSDLVPGRWINLRHPLMRIVASGSGEVNAYLGESQIGAVAVGQKVYFYPEATNWPVVAGTVAEIDPAAGRTIAHPLLASLHGGGIAATQAARDTMVAHETIYRVRIRTSSDASGFDQVVRGTVRIETNWLLIGRAGLSHIFSVLLRESGF